MRVILYIPISLLIVKLFPRKVVPVYTLRAPSAPVPVLVLVRHGGFWVLLKRALNGSSSTPRVWGLIAPGENPSSASDWFGDLWQVKQFVLVSSHLKGVLISLVVVQVQ